MEKHVLKNRLIGRRELCSLLGNISISQVIRLEHQGGLNKARVPIGLRAVRYDLSKVMELIECKGLY